MADPPAKKSYRLGRDRRLRGDKNFQAVLAARATKRVGPLVVHGKPNDLEHCRMGIRIGRHVGNAPKRNRIKRLLREAFRLNQHDWPRGYDLIVSVRPHETGSLADYQRMLFAAIREIHRHWQRREDKQRRMKDSEHEA